MATIEETTGNHNLLDDDLSALPRENSTTIGINTAEEIDFDTEYAANPTLQTLDDTRQGEPLIQETSETRSFLRDIVCDKQTSQNAMGA